MDARGLKRWKQQQEARGHGVAGTARLVSAPSIRAFYPELTLEEPYTTALDPYVPVWALLPFFKTVVVGILPHLKDEAAFRAWYGLTPAQVLDLHERGHVALRILHPHEQRTIPRYLNPFFELGLPSTFRSELYDEAHLTRDGVEEYRSRFAALAGRQIAGVSIDTFRGSSRRAMRTAARAYIQLRSLGYDREADLCEGYLSSSPTQALAWIEACRLFLVGPVHYSLGGFHLVAQNAVAGHIGQLMAKGGALFPAELGLTLVQRMHHQRFGVEMGEQVDIDALLDLAEFHQLARKVLVTLSRVAVGGDADSLKHDVLSASRTLEELDQRKGSWTRALRLIGVTTGTLGGAAAGGMPGLLLGLAMGLGVEVAGPRVDAVLEPAASYLATRGQPQHTIAIYDLMTAIGGRGSGSKAEA